MVISERFGNNFCGFKKIDELLGGGIPDGYIILIKEDIGAGSNVLMENIIDSLRNIEYRNYSILHCVVDPTYYFLIQDFLSKNNDSKCGLLDVISNNPLSEKENYYHCKYQLQEISLTLKQAKRQLLKNGDQLFLFFWSLNPLIINFNPKDVVKFYYDCVKDCISLGVVGIFQIQKGIASKEVSSGLESLSHGVIDLSTGYEGDIRTNYLNVLKMIGREYSKKRIRYRIENNDFIIE
ncbi:MAG: RAD55 family ATPase [Candidatus Helarchaeota archaeon]